MKKQLLAAATAALLSIAAVNAQDTNLQRKTPEERVQAVHAKLDSAFKLDAEKMKQVDEIFLNSYQEQDKKMDELRASGQPDRDAMMAAREKIITERDAKLKEVLTEEQMKIWKDQIEPTLRPQRANRDGRK